MTRFAELTTLRVGGDAADWASAFRPQDAVAAARNAALHGREWIVLGGGSNLLASDETYPGTVIRMLSEGIVVEEDSVAGVVARVQAGHRWDDFVAWAVLNGLAGIEAMSGIPGTVGGAPVQNIGAYGQEFAETFVDATFWDATSDEIVTLTGPDLDFAFRHSVLKHDRRGIVLDIAFRLARTGSGPEALSRPIMFEQLASALGVTPGATEPIGSVRNKVLALRRSKGMVLDANDPDTFSVGSFFINPIVSERFSRQLPLEAPRYPVGDDEPPRYVAPGEEVPPLANEPRAIKLSAAWLIEQAGVRKGFSLPGSGAGISTKHALALTNRGSATSDDIVQLARYVQSLVHNQFGVLLLPEPTLVGIDL